MDIEEQYDKIYRFCYYKVHSKEDAEDITQEAFLRFLCSGYEDQGKSLNLLYSIARNLCIDEVRRRHPEAPLDMEVSDGGGFEDQVIEKTDLQRAIRSLSPEDQEILLLRFVNEEPLSLISKLTGLSRFALYRRISRLKKKLKEELREGGSFGE